MYMGIGIDLGDRGPGPTRGSEEELLAATDSVLPCRRCGAQGQCAMAEHQFVLLSLCASAVLLLSGPAAAAAPGPTAAAPPAPATPTRSKYIPKWKKQACEAPASLNSASHYECDDNGNVQCLPGWTGDVCDVPICRKGCDPLQGYCKRPGECRCKLGFYGELCNKCIALPGCQHGYCNNSFECICHEGWDGLFCSEPICRLDCHATRGYCEWPGECRCRLGWSGETCKECQVLPGCVHGTCSKPLECKCEKGWTGILCQTPICAESCHKDRGYCRKPGECRCKVGWWGENCEECYRYPGCVHGACHKPWECVCEPGWGGMLCDQELSHCDENPNLCENNGTCVSLPEEDGSYRCLCTDNFTGRNCDVNKTHVIGMRPPPLPHVPIKESGYTKTPPEKEATSLRPVTPIEKETTSPRPSSSSTTSTSPSPVSENNNEAILEEINSSKQPITTTSVKPSLRRASTSRTTDLHRTSPAKQKFRKTPEDKTSESTKRPGRKASRAGSSFRGRNEIPRLVPGESSDRGTIHLRTSESTKHPHPSQKSSQAESSGGMNEIPGLVPAEKSDKGTISITASNGGLINSLRMHGFWLQDDDISSLMKALAGSQTQGTSVNASNDFFESMGSSDEVVTHGNIADEPMALNMVKSRKRRGVISKTVRRFFPAFSSTSTNNVTRQDPNSRLAWQDPNSRLDRQDPNSRLDRQDPNSRLTRQDPNSRLTRQDPNSRYSLNDGIIDNLPESRSIDSHPSKTLIKNEKNSFRSTTEMTLIEIESDGVLEIRPANSPTSHGAKPQGNLPLNVQQKNEALSHNRYEAGLQLTLYNESQVSGITYHDQRKTYHIQNLIKNSYSVSGSKGSNDGWSPPVVNIFLYANGKRCSCNNISLASNLTHPNCTCDESPEIVLIPQSSNTNHSKLNSQTETVPQSNRVQHSTPSAEAENSSSISPTKGIYVKQKNEAFSHNRYEAGLHMTLYNQSHVSGLHYHDQRKSFTPTSQNQTSHQATLDFRTRTTDQMRSTSQAKSEIHSTSPQTRSEDHSTSPQTKSEDHSTTPQTSRQSQSTSTTVTLGTSPSFFTAQNLSTLHSDPLSSPWSFFNLLPVPLTPSSPSSTLAPETPTTRYVPSTSLSPSNRESHHSKVDSSTEENNIVPRHSSSNMDWSYTRNRITDLLHMFFSSGEDPTHSRSLQQHSAPARHHSRHHSQSSSKNHSEGLQPSSREKPIQKIDPKESTDSPLPPGFWAANNRRDHLESSNRVLDDLRVLRNGRGHYST